MDVPAKPEPRDWSLTERRGASEALGLGFVTLDDVDSPALLARERQHFALRYRAALDFRPARPARLA